MALIICSECKKEISDQAEFCIHCGFPIKKQNNEICNINGIQYNLSDFKKRILEFKRNGGKKISTFDPIFNQIGKDMYFKTRLVDAFDLCKIIYETEKIPESYNGELLLPNKPKCPHCNSTNIKPISTTERAASVIGLGIFSKKINKSFKCLNCKYTW